MFLKILELKNYELRRVVNAFRLKFFLVFQHYFFLKKFVFKYECEARGFLHM